jgi:C1A family cysteine protease
MQRKYGLKKSPNRHLRQSYSHMLGEVKLPPVVDLRPDFPECYDQGEFNSCTANSIGAAIHYLIGKYEATPSRMFIYYKEREMQNTQNQDDGSTLQAGIEVCEQIGVCPEPVWKYSQKHLFMPPNPDLLKAPIVKITKAETVNTFDELKHSLAMKFPVVIGIVVFQSFESEQVAQTGIMVMPQPNEQTLGGHALCVVGYDDTKQSLIVRNSWGIEWGLDGYFYMPYSFAQNPDYCWDWWSIQSVTQNINL